MNIKSLARFIAVTASSCLILITVSTASYAGCNTAADCSDDGDPCTIEACVASICTHKVCGTFDEAPCKVFECSADGSECVNVAGGSTCDDGNPCTTLDSCESGDCVGGPIDPTCNAPCTPGSCDDDNPCTMGECSGNGDCTYTAMVRPDGDCLQPREASFRLRDRDDDSQDELRWEWEGGDAFDSWVLGAPRRDTSYTLCIFDHEAGIPRAVGFFTVEPDEKKWKNKGSKGRRYSDRSRSSDGVEKVTLKTGRHGKGKVDFRAKGVNMPTPPGVDPQYFTQDRSVVVQLINSLGTCWSSSFTESDTKKNRLREFRAKTEDGRDHDRDSDSDSGKRCR